MTPRPFLHKQWFTAKRPHVKPLCVPVDSLIAPLRGSLNQSGARIGTPMRRPVPNKLQAQPTARAPRGPPLTRPVAAAALLSPGRGLGEDRFAKAGGLGVAILSHRRLFAGLGLPAGEAEGTFAPASVAGLGASLLPRSLFLGVSEKLLTACRPQAAGS